MKKFCLAILTALMLLTTGCSTVQELIQKPIADIKQGINNATVNLSEEEKQLLGEWILKDILDIANITLSHDSTSSIIFNSDLSGVLYKDQSLTEFTWKYSGTSDDKGRLQFTTDKGFIFVLIPNSSTLMLSTPNDTSQITVYLYEKAQSSTNTERGLTNAEKTLVGNWLLEHIMQENNELIEGLDMSIVKIAEDYSGNIKIYKNAQKTDYQSYDFTWKHEKSTDDGEIYSTDLGIELGVYTKYENDMLVVHVPNNNQHYFYTKDTN